MKEKYIKDHIEKKGSYRDLKRNKYINSKKICQWVNEYGKNAKKPQELSKELEPNKWSGYLVVDGKNIKVAGKKNSIVLGVDYTGDIPATEYEDGNENKTQYARLFRSLRSIGYPLKGVVSDGNPDIVAALREIFPNIPHQTCLKHFMRGIDRSFGYLQVKKAKKQKEFAREIEMRDKIQRMIYSSTYEKFVEKYEELQREMTILESVYCMTMWKKVQYNLTSLTAHFFDRKLHTTNNLAENAIKQLNKRLKLIEGFSSVNTAEGYLRLLITYWRFKKYTDSVHKNRNGRSRLNVAGVNIDKLDWLRASQKPKNKKKD